MKILYVGQLWEGSTCLERMGALQTLGCEVIPFNTMPWLTAGGRWRRSFTSRFHRGSPVKELNAALIKFSSSLPGFTFIWIDKGQWFSPDTLEQIRRHTGGRLIHYTPDPQLTLHQSRHFSASIPFYDLVVTTKAFEVNLYEMAGAKRIVLVLQGYDDRFSPIVPTPVDRAEFASDVCFIGHYERYYAHRLKAASWGTECLRIWGPRWKRYRWFHPWALRHVYGDGLWGKKYLLGLASSKIALGLLSKRIPEASTTRSFEIPATGVFMLAERTDEHLAYFTEGAEAEFFGCDQELTDKISFYLRHDALRKRIAAAGRERCIRSNYHSRYQLSRVLQEAS